MANLCSGEIRSENRGLYARADRPQTVPVLVLVELFGLPGESYNKGSGLLSTGALLILRF